MPPTRTIETWPERIPLESRRSDLAVQIPMATKAGFEILRASVLGIITASGLLRRRARSNASADAANNQKVIAVDDAAPFVAGDALKLEDGTAVGVVAVGGVNVEDNELTCVDNLAVAITDGDAILGSDGSQVAKVIANEAVKATETANTNLSPYAAGVLKRNLLVGLDESAIAELGGRVVGDDFIF
ncbi:MAG TPA: hypothetical protein VIW64_16230 [Pyrinomonadaceae bacterium]